MLHISTSAHSTLVEICFINIFCEKKPKKEERARKLRQNLADNFFLACTQTLVEDKKVRNIVDLAFDQGLGANSKKRFFAKFC